MLSTFTTSRSSGSFVEVAWKNGIVRIGTSVSLGRFRSMISLFLGQPERR